MNKTTTCIKVCSTGPNNERPKSLSVNRNSNYSLPYDLNKITEAIEGTPGIFVFPTLRHAKLFFAEGQIPEDKICFECLYEGRMKRITYVNPTFTSCGVKANLDHFKEKGFKYFLPSKHGHYGLVKAVKPIRILERNTSK